MASGGYRLDFEPAKRNVFVTQLHQREDEEEVQQFPIITESAGKLLENGTNTLQKTLLLKKEVEVDRVDEELREKRNEFRSRMAVCSERQTDIQKRQQRMKDRVVKFEKFIKENEAKRRRAIQKYQAEVKLNEQKKREFELLESQLAELEKRHEHLKNKLEKYKIYEDYLNKVVDILPANYLEVSESMLKSLMMRHRTLAATNKGLVDNLQSMVDELESEKQNFKEMKLEHDKLKVSNNGQLSHKTKHQEKLQHINQETEQNHGLGKVEFRAQLTDYGQIVMAIDNIAEKCRRETDSSLDQMHLDDKLAVITEYMNEKMDIARMAGSSTSSSHSDRKSNAPSQSLADRMKDW